MLAVLAVQKVISVLETISDGDAGDSNVGKAVLKEAVLKIKR